MVFFSYSIALSILLISSECGGGASALLSLVRPRSTFHRCQSAVRFSAKHDDDNEEASLRQAIERLVTLIGPTAGEENVVKPPSDGEADNHHSPSIVHIIGTGLTPTLLSLPLSTLHLLSQADAVLYDSLGLSHDDICRVVPTHCDVVCVGKRGDSQKSWKQSEIDDLILQKAMMETKQQPQQQKSSKPKTILRLKGGDPFLFGRARTEIETLKSNRIPYTYTPAISSCIAAPHLGGIPLTDPTLNCQSFAVYSGTDAFGRSRGLGNDSYDAIDDKWDGLDVDTLVFLMIGRLDKLEALCNLLAGSDDEKWNENTHCAVIQNAGGRRSIHETDSLPGGQKVQRVWRGTLRSIVPMIRKEDQDRTSVSPAVFVVGATCQLDFLSY